jgi:ATP-dependent Lhr-like helicase
MSEAEAEAGPGWRGWLDALAKEKRASRLSLSDGKIWIAAERLAQFRMIWPEAKLNPVIAAPSNHAASNESVDTALVEILRGRLEGLGPVTPTELGAPLGLKADEVAAPLIALQSEGFAMRGRFTSAASEEEWCERRLLARIHRYTVRRLRAEIEPVAARDFLRFLIDWQRVAADARMEGPDAVDTIIAQLEGFEAPAGAWEAELLSARIAGYDPAWLDDLCLSGRVAWARLRPRSAPVNGERSVAPSPVRSTPITLLARRHAPFWLTLSPAIDDAQPSAKGQAVAAYIREHGASFFDELADGTNLLRPEVEEALGELVALGLVSSNSFAGLRALLLPSDQRKGSRRRRAASSFAMDGAGRWALARRIRPTQSGPQSEADAIEHLARTLLRRYGVVFWRLLEREAPWLPPWRELLRIYRKLEARGDIRGGRFVAGFSGEQFALPDAIGALRETRRKQGAGDWISVSGADPLNLAGILTPGVKLPALTTNRLLYRDGLPIAFLAGGEVRFIETVAPSEEWEARKALLRSPTLTAPATASTPDKDSSVAAK